MSLHSNLGILYIVATPIGNLNDFTFRAVEILSAVDIIAAEDTRHSKKLLQHYGISTACMAVHEHNEKQALSGLIRRLSEGKDVALISDAGTPLICDPGYPLVKAVRSAGFRIIPIPGSNAAIAALSAAGLPTDRFCFQGFLPAKSNARRLELQALSTETRTMVFYETPHRVRTTVEDMCQIFGTDRLLVLARELTKLHEHIHLDNLENMIKWLQGDANHAKGEMVLVLEGCSEVCNVDEVEEDRILKLILQELSTKKAAALTATITGGKKNRLYQRALEIQGKD
ncbi:MAG: 16S rRNA (cytidine(1402)-2'-O)-methyltransferase [Thiohalomonadales bacterium]